MSNAKFEWNEITVKEFIIFYNSHKDWITGIDPIVSKMLEFKKSKEVKPDYEILSFIEKPEAVELGDKPLVLKVSLIPKIYKLEDYLKADSSFNINSVCRISDGEVFCLGDFVCETINTPPSTWHITEFSLKDSRCFTCGVNINNIEKVKSKAPLFTTEDGFDIYHNTKYWQVEVMPPTYKTYEAHTAIAHFKNKYETSYYNNAAIKKFSTEEAAKQYVSINKPKSPLLKLDDGTDVFEGDTVYTVNIDSINPNTVEIRYNFNERNLLNAKDCGYYWFSTEEKAQEWLDEHKKCFSIKDIKDAIKTKHFIGADYLLETLKNLKP